MKLKPIHSLTTLEPLRGLKPLTTCQTKILNIPNSIELLLLSSNLLYVANRMIKKEINGSNQDIDRYTVQAIEIMKSADDYENRYISNKEFRKIRKDFKLNKLYDNDR